MELEGGHLWNQIKVIIASYVFFWRDYRFSRPTRQSERPISSAPDFTSNVYKDSRPYRASIAIISRTIIYTAINQHSRWLIHLSNCNNITASVRTPDKQYSHLKRLHNWA
ncbi:hypothetical protein CIPAW_03G098900 [Carya illinoinensis]|uniref:Uncharacterized protein n=1 Tax=Carya illinoinensis TaxID=32201 RepID=A0A8T1QYY7_CARIL|nr:hypothetical protein CIPAW_03G098900 [Carya illinoinensis]